MRKECTGYRMVCGVFGILLSTYSGCVGISVCDLDQDGWCLPDDCDPLESQINPDQEIGRAHV